MYSVSVERQYFRCVLVTGGHGFIGSHIALELLRQGVRVRIVDVALAPPLLQDQVYDFIQGSLCDPVECRRALQGVTSVFHFAANMGGMGTIHEENDLIIYRENHLMTLNLVSACDSTRIRRFFYASSACVYPDSLQKDALKDVSLRERDVWINLSSAPSPQGLYGLEKLNTEQLLLQSPLRLDIRIARFHNVYGIGGAWNNGREKAPAALLRKAYALKFRQGDPMTFEIWGDGSQRRSFLWIDDAVDGVLRLFDSESVEGPVNIGSDEAITIQALAELALKAANVDRSRVTFRYLKDKPIGVASRNSDNTYVTDVLKWEPTTSIEEGMRQTGAWIEDEIKSALASPNGPIGVEDLQQSRLVQLGTERTTFVILLPVTSRGSGDPSSCLDNLAKFSSSFVRTTWRDTQSTGGVGFHARFCVAIDDDDDYLRSPTEDAPNRAEAVLMQAGLADIVTVTCDYPPGHVCSIWRQCAQQAWKDGADYFVLLGDDVILLSEGWMRDVHAEFQRLSENRQVPIGFGCVCFTDLSFPGMPTFPVVHRTHMDIFGGIVVPDIFVNQGGDPFLFQLYRRWGCSSMLPCSLTNGVGGSGAARYVKQRAVDWTFETLDNAIDKAAQWLTRTQSKMEKMLTIDIVIPCFRVDLPILQEILSLKVSRTCSTMFIVIIDNPNSPYAFELESRYGNRPDVRIRRNAANIGASGSRNRGMDESSADWIIFLDDDVIPRTDLLVEAEKAIRRNPTAAGFVGNSLFPPSSTIFTTAVRIAGVTYFWDIAAKISDDVPWGVTANLIARRNVRDGVKYNLICPKTGGGEDIEFCRLKRAYSLAQGGQGFMAAPEVVITHPWWDNGIRCYRRFYMWSYGDGALVKRFPEISYWDFSFNSAEMLLLSILSFPVLPMFLPFRAVPLVSLRLLASVVTANIIHDCYRHLWRDTERHRDHRDMNTTLSGPRYALAVIESTAIRMASEMGRLHGMLSRGELSVIGKRFDWFAGRWGEGPKNEERKNNLQRAAVTVAIFSYLNV